MTFCEAFASVPIARADSITFSFFDVSPLTELTSGLDTFEYETMDSNEIIDVQGRYQGSSLYPKTYLRALSCLERVGIASLL
jgi:hypothetical protein